MKNYIETKAYICADGTVFKTEEDAAKHILKSEFKSNLTKQLDNTVKNFSKKVFTLYCEYLKKFNLINK